MPPTRLHPGMGTSARFRFPVPGGLLTALSPCGQEWSFSCSISLSSSDTIEFTTTGGLPVPGTILGTITYIHFILSIAVSGEYS